MHLARIEEAGNTKPRAYRHMIQSAGRFALAAAALVSVAGCGNNYRPVVTAINPVGPAAQPQKYAVVVSSSPNAGTPGLMTLVDFSGDTVLVTPQVGVAPYYLALDSTGATGFTLNGDGTLTSFDISTSLQTKDVLQTTLLSGAAPVSLLALNGGSTYIAEPGRNSVAQLSGSPLALKQEFPVIANVVYVVGAATVSTTAGTTSAINAPRAYIISQGATPGVSNGAVQGIETATNTLSSGTLPVGRGPVYGVMTADGKRTFILNKTDGTVTVINSQTNLLDIPNNTIPVGVAPIWADLLPARSELLVANSGDGTTPGTLSVVNTPLCNVAAQVSNPLCDLNNPVDAVGFGQVLANVPVGHNPVMVSVLQDAANPRAYVANYSDSTVSVVNLTTNTVTATIPVVGRPIYIAATVGTPTGKVYVVSADAVSPNKNSVMTIINTDTDTVKTTINLQGTGVSVRVTAQ